MGVASTLMSRFCRILPPVTIITICFYFLIKLSLFSNAVAPDPGRWKNHALDFVEEDEEGYTPTFETTAVPTPRQTSAAEIEDLENKGEIGDFADDDEFLPFVNIEDDGDWDEEDLQEMSGEKYENETVDEEGDWSRFAYIQYVTNEDYLCNSVMIFEALHRLGSKADRLLMYPQEMLDPEAEHASSHGGKLLIRARDEYNVTLQPIEIQHRDGQDETWADSFTKLLAFNQTQYERVLSLDSDSTVLQHMDELFELPPCPVAMPRAYWLYNDNPPKKILSSQLMLIQPDEVEFERIVQKMNSIGPNDYDMEIVNSLYLDSALILPHRKYDMLTAEFRAKDHSAYLGSEREQWDPNAVLNEAKFVHFSDWPVPKPWINDPEVRLQNQPDCATNETTCAEREIWNGFYTDFRDNRERVYILMALLKKALLVRDDLKVVVMSATIDIDKFVKYFVDAKRFTMSVRIFPIEVGYIENPTKDYLSLSLHTTKHVHEQDNECDILVFLPTTDDCEEGCAKLRKATSDLDVLPLYSLLLQHEQDRLFKRSDKRRCVLAMNIAEADILIGLKICFSQLRSRSCGCRFGNGYSLVLPCSPCTQLI
ncbi:glucose n-acetyltransferase 1 [Fusarium sp. NRRL 52700]|nr:glucose n-acetyltransferase 1 [Fusarium sp. NRRL 52700]